MVPYSLMESSMVGLLMMIIVFSVLIALMFCINIATTIINSISKPTEGKEGGA